VDPVDVDPLALPPSGGTSPTVREALEYQAEMVRRAHGDGRTAVARLLRSHGLASGSDAEILAAPLSPGDARLLVAREHWYPDWATAMAHGSDRVDRRFEAAVAAVVTGDLDTLRALLAQEPALVAARSAYGHHAMLLHHVAANGVEHTRQRSPANAPQVAQVLLAAGAEPDAVCDSYTVHRDTTMGLLVSSAHPALAGVQADLVEVLCDGGARPDGPDEDGAPLWTAITWGYTDSARRLVRCGARVDNLVFAAVTGDVEQVRAYFGGDGAAPLPSSAERVGRHGPGLDPDLMVEYALIYAAMHGRAEIVEFLLSKGPDLSVREPVHGATARGGAGYPHPAAGRPDGSPSVVRLLEAAGAS
jgi:ankyrin repeat protein